MPFREKSAWASLVTVFCVYGVYFAILVPRLAASGSTPPPYLGLLLGCVAVLIVAQIVAQTAVAVTMAGDANLPRDERERAIGLKSDRVALSVLTTLLACGWLAYMFAPLARWREAGNPAVLANALLFALVAAALAKFGSQIVYFHRAA